MNLSGSSVKAIVDFYKIESHELIVISDDVDLPVGTIRIRKGGASGGHNGLQNIIDTLGSDDFYRLRLGVSRPVLEESKIETKDYVLSKFSDRDWPIFESSVNEGVLYLLEYVGGKKEITSHTIEVVS
jgi:PTH1 family peptidyl-tRNA hydrolase